jgi:hypothetical protein
MAVATVICIGVFLAELDLEELLDDQSGRKNYGFDETRSKCDGFDLQRYIATPSRIRHTFRPQVFSATSASAFVVMSLSV